MRMPFEETPIGHMIDQRELAESRARRSAEVRVLRELAAARLWRRVQRIAGRMGLRRVAAVAGRAATRRASRARPGAPGRTSAPQHTAWW